MHVLGKLNISLVWPSEAEQSKPLTLLLTWLDTAQTVSDCLL